MIATMHDAAREKYEAELGLPARGSRVWITGFPRQDHAAAARLLERHGLLATAFAAGADCILAPDPPSEDVVQAAERSGRRLIGLRLLEGHVAPPPRRSAVEVTAETVRILDVTLPRRERGGPLVPTADRFGHLCLDATFLAAARAVATGTSSRGARSWRSCPSWPIGCRVEPPSRGPCATPSMRCTCSGCSPALIARPCGRRCVPSGSERARPRRLMAAAMRSPRPWPASPPPTMTGPAYAPPSGRCGTSSALASCPSGNDWWRSTVVMGWGASRPRRRVRS